MMMNVTVVCGGKWKNIQKERDRWKWRNKDNKKRRDGKSALLFSSSFIFDVRFRSLLLDFSRPACDTVASGTGKEFFFCSTCRRRPLSSRFRSISSVCTGFFYRVFLQLTGLSMFPRTLSGFTGFYWVLLGFIKDVYLVYLDSFRFQ